MEKILEVRKLTKYFPAGRDGFFIKKQRYVKALDDVSFFIDRGETLGLVGESGCGKSTLARTIIRLHEPTSGEIFFENESITSIKRSELNRRRRNIQFIFQDPYASLNPRLTVGEIVAEPLLVYRSRRLFLASNKEIKQRVRELLAIVGLSPHHYNRYPHEFSGGQRQRIGIARALALQPKLILCDEPVSALDVSIQAQIINLLQDLQKEFSLTYLFISHDLSVVRHISNRVAVMYLGKIIEIAGYEEIYKNPWHPYTKALLSSVPIPDPVKEKTRKRIILEGDVSDAPGNAGGYCGFQHRCPARNKACLEQLPELREVSSGHYVACLYS